MYPPRIAKGFTLIELVIGIVVFSIVLVTVTALIAPQAQRSVDPILQVRATELAQSLLNEITAKSFDENSDRTGGAVRCGEDLNGSNGADDTDIGELGDCTDPADLANEESAREDFDDIDDYNGLDQTGGAILNSQGETISVDGKNLYAGFRAQVDVFYDANGDGDPDSAIGDYKLIRVTITTPTDQQLVFASYRSNY